MDTKKFISNHVYQNNTGQVKQLVPKISNVLVLYVNGKKVISSDIDPMWTLLYFLRNKLQLVGTKLGCAEGGCGACTVLISRYDRKLKKIIHRAGNACLIPVCTLHGNAVTTIEGIGSNKTKLHIIQERIAKAHGSQCGFCTPGIVMSMYALLRNKQKPSMHDIEIAFQGNLCRCTGYRPIIEAFKSFTEGNEKYELTWNIRNIVCAYDKICSNENFCCKDSNTHQCKNITKPEKYPQYNYFQEAIFPSELQLSAKYDEEYLVIKGNNNTWYKPTVLQEILVLKHQYPNAKVVVGNTEVGVEVKFKHFIYPVLISPIHIQEMREKIVLKNSLKLGASLNLVEIEDAFQELINTQIEYKTRIFKMAVDMLHRFAGKQIRNFAAIGGNIMTGSPISDMNPILMAAGTKLEVSSLEKGFRTIMMDDTFFTGYRRNTVAPDEILVSIEIPFTLPNQYCVAYKQSKRREDDIAIINLAINVHFLPETSIVESIRIAIGGIAPITVLAKKTCAAIVGRKWNAELVEFTTSCIAEEFPLPNNAPGGLVSYRRSLTLSLFFKGFVEILKQLQKKVLSIIPLPKNLESAGETFHYIPAKSSQYYEIRPSINDKKDLLGKPIVHMSALKQATGEALYLDDIPKFGEELYLSFVLSTRAHAKIINVDSQQALKLKGVVAFFNAKDIQEQERYVGPIVHDEEIFVSEQVTSQGQIIAVVVAVDQQIAQKAARLVNVEYEDIQPIIISIEDAIKANSFFAGSGKSIIKGCVEKEFLLSDHILEGELRMGGQEHFYLETHSALAIPREDDELEIFCSTQHPSEIQKLISHMLNIPMNKINVRVKRIGGGFGGKESRGMLVALPVALAAYRLRKPVRCMLDRDEDMMMTGTRHPFLYKYKVGFTNEGLLKAIDVNIYSNGGYSLDLSMSVLERAMFHIENSYKISAIRVFGYVCKTNLPSNTAFRGFGGPQGMFVAENIIRHVADYLGQDAIEISNKNLYHENDVTHYNQILENCTLRQCWSECLQNANAKDRLENIKIFNQQHKYRKRGFAAVPTKFGIAFTALFLNQAGALIHVYIDGSVLLSHGGIEMGQGLHTKMIQITSRILKVNPDKICISETATDKVPNTSATAASAGSDLNGMAVLNACNKIMKKIEYIIHANPNGTWEDWVKQAYLDRVSLSATGFYRTPDIGYDFIANRGNPFNYFTYGAACSEVEIDCLTGDHQVLRTDIVMDLGESLNPAIDIGQIEGGFIQGYGLFTMEEMIYSPSGTVFSRGPGVYKIPGFTDIPSEFNVSLLKEACNPRAVYSSKAVGEPPLFLASSIFFAIKEAIRTYREEMNINGYFRLDSPATCARIRMACIDDLTKKVGCTEEKSAWNINP